MTELNDINRVSNDKIIQQQNTLVTLHKILGEIGNGNLSDDIIRYIAPKFYTNTKLLEE